MRYAAVIRALVALSISVLASGCVTTDAPIGTTVGLRADPALIGDWSTPDDAGQQATLTIVPVDANTMVGILRGQGPNGKPVIQWTTFNTVRLGKHDFMNETVWSPDRDGKLRRYPDAPQSQPHMYEITGDTLTVWEADTDAAAAAVESGRIEGKVSKYDSSDSPPQKRNGSVEITASGLSLDAFVQTLGGIAMFTRTEPKVFTRIPAEPAK